MKRCQSEELHCATFLQRRRGAEKDATDEMIRRYCCQGKWQYEEMMFERGKTMQASDQQIGKQVGEKNSAIKCRGVGSVLLLLAVIGYLTAYSVINLFHYNHIMNSDIGAEPLLAREIWETGQIVPSTWYASSETQIFSIPVLAAPFYGLTGSMNLAMGIGLAIGAAVFALLVYRLARTVGMTKIASLSAVLLCLAVPGSMENASMLYLFAGYYLTNTIAMVLTLLIYEKLAVRIQTVGRHVESGERRLGPGLTLGIAISLGVAFLTGMCGMRSLLTIYLPLVGMEALFWIFSLLFRTVLFRGGKAHQDETEERVISRVSLQKRGWLSLLTLGYAAAAFLGGLSPLSVHMGTTRNLRHGLEKLLREVLPALFNCIGFDSSSIVIRVLLVLLTVISFVVLGMALRPYCTARMWAEEKSDGSVAGEETGEFRHIGKQYTGRQRHLILFFWMSLLFFMAANSFTTTATAPRYFYVSYIIMAFSTAVLWDRILAGRWHRCASAAGCALVLLVSSVFFTVYMVPVLREGKVTNEKDAITEWMAEHDVEYGYAVFDIANEMTARCDGQVQVSAVADLGKLKINRWLSSKRWYCPFVDENTPATYIVNKNDLERFRPQLEQHPDIRLAMETEHYNVYYAEHNYSSMEQ